MNENGPSVLKRWLTVAVLVAGWLLSAAVQWGAFSARMTAVEKTAEGKLDRAEYEARQKDLLDRLDRIERKIDRNYRSGGKQ